MKHYILSRFNSEPLDPIQWEKRKFLDWEWINQRLELARNYRKSLKNQREKNFEVVVACHKDSPPEVTKFFGEFAQVWFGQIHEFPFDVGSITTRLDTDDLIHKQFTQKVREIAEADRRRWLVDFDTAWYDIRTKRAGRFMRKHNNSQFLSVTRSNRQFHCYTSAHTSMASPSRFPKQSRIRLIGGLQIIHANNILSKTPTHALPIDLNLRDYGL